ncbi:MAG TPA: ABC transporter substrate-binding protein [Caulobacteraceae bacterium]|nr:ABC transporter substrate-binding protein [Caulobacteraceae bacterium]
MAASTRLLGAIAAAGVLAFAGGAAHAAADPAATQIERFDQALLSSMHGGAALGVRGRVRLLTPTVEAVFDIPMMTRFAVGPGWATMSDSDHQALVAAFERLVIASYAHNFDSEGTHFDVAANVETRGPDKLVQCKIIPAHGDTANVLYRMREDGGSWKVIDVFYNNSISELTTKRSDFASSLAAGGAHALVEHIDAQTAKLMK